MRYHRPGAYYERTDRARARPVVVRTDVSCFIGIAQQGPIDTPVPVESFRQFQSHFGDFSGAGFLAWSVKGFFENGGQRCWIVRVASRRVDLGAKPASLEFGVAGAGWRIAASSAGGWGNELTARLRRELRTESAIDVAASTPTRLSIERTAGLERFSHVEIAQPGKPAQYAVIASVDPANGAVSLTGEPGFPYPFQAIVLDPALPARLISVSYAIVVQRGGRHLFQAAGLSQVPEHPAYAPRVLSVPDYALAWQQGQPVAVPPPVIAEDLTVHAGVPPAPLAGLPDRASPLTGGAEGLAALTPGDFTGEVFSSRDPDDEALFKLRGIRCLELVDEIALVAVPDIVTAPDPLPLIEPEIIAHDPCDHCPQAIEPRRAVTVARGDAELPPEFTHQQIEQVQAALLTHCEARGDRFAVLDAPADVVKGGPQRIAGICSWRRRFDSAAGALYFPWLRVPDPRMPDRLRAIPPSGHALGRFAAHDIATGAHRTPANDRLNWVQDLTLHASHGEQEVLNDLAINAIRSEAQRGLRIMGGRTLSSDPAARFVNVRRLIQLIRRATRILSQWAVFEPNSDTTRAGMATVIENLLDSLWQRGAFAGETQEEGYFVRCDETTSSAADREEGRLIALVGIAPALPLEFIVVRVGMQGNELTVRESGELARAA